MPSLLDSNPSSWIGALSSGVLGFNVAKFQGFKFDPSCGPLSLEAYNVSAHFLRGGKGLTNFLHLHVQAREPYGNRRAASLLLVNLSPIGLHESQTASPGCRRIKTACRLLLNSIICASFWWTCAILSTSAPPPGL